MGNWGRIGFVFSPLVILPSLPDTRRKPAREETKRGDVDRFGRSLVSEGWPPWKWYYGNFDRCYPILCYGCCLGDLSRKYSWLIFRDYKSHPSIDYPIFYQDCTWKNIYFSWNYIIGNVGKFEDLYYFLFFSSLAENDIGSNYKFWLINLLLTTS